MKNKDEKNSYEPPRIELFLDLHVTGDDLDDSETVSCPTDEGDAPPFPEP